MTNPDVFDAALWPELIVGSDGALIGFAWTVLRT